jgi:hypothetical protein
MAYNNVYGSAFLCVSKTSLRIAGGFGRYPDQLWFSSASAFQAARSNLLVSIKRFATFLVGSSLG